MIKIPKNLTGPELIKFLYENKEALIKQKSDFPVYSDAKELPYQFGKKSTIKSIGVKAPIEVIEIENGELPVVAIGNAANWVDCQMDVLLPDCWKKTIKESGPAGKNRVKHLHDHEQKVKGQVGQITDLYSQDFSLQDLGINMTGQTQCLVMESMVKEAYNSQVFNLYKDKQINQHSIGLQYVKLDIAINDPNYPAEFAIWNKYFAQIINKDVVTKAGYFWAVYEIKLLEVSAVLWGANELTPTVASGYMEDDEDKSLETSTSNNSKQEPDSTSTQVKSVSEMIKSAEIKINL